MPDKRDYVSTEKRRVDSLDTTDFEHLRDLMVHRPNGALVLRLYPTTCTACRAIADKLMPDDLKVRA